MSAPAQGPLSGRVALVTGAGRGLGRAHALALAASGARVIVNDLGTHTDGSGAGSSPAGDVVGEIRAAGGEAVANADDVSSVEGARRIVEQAIDEFGALDVVVNNAGILRDRALVNMAVEDFDAVIAVHLRGTFLATQAAAQYWRGLAKDGRPVQARLINTTSGSGLFGNFGQANYAAAKAGIAALTLVSAAELAPYGVTANAIAPIARTRMLDTVSDDPHPTADDPLAPENVSPLVAWLAGPHSSSVSGRVFSVSGGFIGVLEGWRVGPDIQTDGRFSYDEIDRRLPAAVAAAAPNLSPAESSPYTSGAQPR